MRTLVFEPDFTGHHYAYLSLLLPALAGLAGEVILTTVHGGAASEPYRTFLLPHADRFTLDASLRPPARRGLRGALGRADDLLTTIRRVRPDHIYIPYADGLAQALGLKRALNPRAVRAAFSADAESEALFLRGAFAYLNHADGLKRRLTTLLSWRAAALAPFTVRHHLDPIVYERIARRGSAAAAGWRLMPDPVETPPPADRAGVLRTLGIPPGGRCIGCAGMIDRRKGADLLLRAFAAATLFDTDRLLLIGPHEPHVRGLLRAEFAHLVRAGRVVSIDGFVPTERLVAAVSAVDLVCTPYPRHIGSASIVIRAAAARRPVLGSGFGWVGWTVPRFGLGWTCDVEDIPAFAAAITAALDAAPSYTPPPQADRFVRFHTPENFVACWTARLRERLGLPPAPDIVRWEEVLGPIEWTPTLGQPKHSLRAESPG